MENTIDSLRLTKTKSEMHNRTEIRLKNTQNTRLVIWNNTLKFEYNKQTMLLQEKKETCKKNQNELNELKRKEAKVRRQYNEMLN